MTDVQDGPAHTVRFSLQSERLGPLPLVNHFIERIGLEEALQRHVPSDARCAVPHARALGVLLRSLIVEREPIYRQQETVHGFASGMFGIDAQEMEHLSDDRLGRALDHLFDADRAALLTEVVVAVAGRFGLRLDELHNDSTSISFCGSYRGATGRAIRGRSAPAIVFGHSKAHRPDLKQLLFILSTTADGHVPVAFRCTDGNVNDSRTHIETWNTLRTIAGRADFLLRCGQQAVLAREHGSHRSCGRTLRHRDAAQPPGGRRVPQMDSDPHAQMGERLGPGQPAAQRGAARLLVRLSRAAPVC